MNKPNTLLTLALILTFFANAISCSMCKITKNGKTVVGNNEDFFAANTAIHFRKGLNGNYGFAFLKYGDFGGFQGGMNEAGLVFDGFAVSERKPRNTFEGKPPLDSALIVEIMQKCKSVYEVKSKFSKYDLNTINGGMHLFVDKEGNYLVVESDTLTIGNDPTYALSCFSPSSKENSNKVALGICEKGKKLLASNFESNVDYCKMVMDTMHQDWKDGSGGTLYTTIYDLSEGTINLYFYHDYNHCIKFDLRKAFQKRDTVISIPSLFPENKEGQKHFAYSNYAQTRIKLLKNIDYAKDSMKVKALVESDSVKPFIRFYETKINDWGYDYMNKGEILCAINLLKINTKYRPKSYNAFDSLGEAYMKNKQYDLALKNYERSVELDPNWENGKTQIAKLKELLKKKG
jgi:tetratricopeptide (TPR) repeat protein